MNSKNFVLTPLAAAILLTSSGASAQAIAPIVSNVDNQVIDVQAGEVINAVGVNGVDIVNENVTLNNDGAINSDLDAANIAAAGAIIDNVGTIDGDVNGVNFVNGQGSGALDNGTGATIQSDSRAVNIGGTVTVTNEGDILGAGDQRNGTVYADSAAQDFSVINTNTGTIDAGDGNQGAGFSAELSETGNNFSIDNDGDLIGRGDASAGAATAGDGIRLERTRVGGALDGTTTGLFTGEINNSER